MKWAFPTIVVLLAMGCSANKPIAHHSQPPLQRNPVPTAALAFDPPVVAEEYIPLNLWRDRREAAAFVGFDEISTTFYSVYQDDRQVIYDNGDSRFERRATSVKVGVSYR